MADILVHEHSWDSILPGARCRLYCSQGATSVTAKASTFSVTFPSFSTYLMSNMWAVVSGGQSLPYASGQYVVRPNYGITVQGKLAGINTYIRIKDVASSPAQNQQYSLSKPAQSVITWSWPKTVTLNTGDHFTQANKNTKVATVPLIVFAGSPSQWGYYSSPTTAPQDPGAVTYADFNYQMDSPGSSDVTVAYATVTLDAPPTFDSTDVTLSRNPAYAGYTTATVTISNLSAKYGGDISSVVLKIGNQTASRTDNGTLSINLNAAGSYTPTVTVTDSRGQTTTKNLAQITVRPYSPPTVLLAAERTASTGVAEDEGESAVLNAKFTFADDVADLAVPTVVVKDPNNNILSPTITWYSTRNNNGTLSNPISDWSTVADGATVYALLDNTGHNIFNTQYSYQISVTPRDTDVNSQTHSGTTITQTLGSAFYTMDFLAGGHGIAFGKAATEEGFEDDMDTTLNKSVYLALLNYQTSGSDDKALYDAIPAGWSDVITQTNIVNIKKLLVRIINSL